MPSIAEIYQNLHTLIFDVDRIPIAIAAIFLSMLAGIVTGPFRGNANPFFWLFWDVLLGKIGNKLDKIHRSRSDLIFRGFLLTAFGVFLAVSLGKFAAYLSDYISFYHVVDILSLYLCITIGAVWYILLKLYFALEGEKLEQGAYYAIARTARTDLNSTDNYGITRTAMSLAVRSLDKGMVAPVFWYIIGGLPFVFAYTCLAALAWRFGKDGFTKGFGAVPLALEKLFGFIPSLLSAVLVTFSSVFTPSAGIARSITSWLSTKNAAPYEQGGLPLSVMARALNISLGGPVKDLQGSVIKREWVGPEKATAQIDHRHIRRGIYVNLIAHLLFLAVLLSAYIWGQLLPVS